MALLCVGFIACINQSYSNNPASDTNNPAEQVKDSSITKENSMQQLISIVEIPVVDFPRAVAFYKEILSVSIEEVDMDGIQMGVLSANENAVQVALVKGPDYHPTTEGSICYLNAGSDLQTTLDKIEVNGGKVLVPKTEISPEMGFFALFMDSEGNKLGLHSPH